VLKQLVAHLGDEVFLTGLRDYFQTHAYGNATLADLLAAWQRAGAADLDSWARDWLQTSGLDTLSILGSELVRQPPAGASVARPHTIAVAALGGDGVEVARRLVTLTGERLGLELAGGGAVLVPDGGAAPVPAAGGAALSHSADSVLVPDADDSTWAKIRFDTDWTTMAELLPAIELPATRVVVVNAFRDAVRNAEVDPGLALEALLEAAAVDDEDVVVGSVLRFCGEVLAAGFTPVDRRPERLARVHRAARAVIDGAGSGSDRQLLGFRYAIASCVDVKALRHWLDGQDLPPGLQLDPELIWSIVVRLAEVGGDADAIEHALQRDPSAAGCVHAARARASLPDPAAKAAAWSALVGSSELPASELYAVAKGFFRPGQTVLTGPYVSRFFDEMPDTAAFRSGWALGQIVSDAFPLAHASSDTLELAERALAGELPAAVRRSVTDGTDALRRAVTSQRRFG
jgi:aminopeptidase N